MWCVQCRLWSVEVENVQCEVLVYSRRKFRSQTSHNMNRWKAEMGRVREEKRRRKKIQVREKVGKSRNTVFCQWFVAPEGRKVGSLKQQVRSQPARWEMKKRTMFGPLWKLWCRKSARRCGAKHISKSKCTKHLSFGALLEVAMSKKCTLLWREAHFQDKSVKNWLVRSTFERSDGRRKGLCTLQNVRVL